MKTTVSQPVLEDAAEPVRLQPVQSSLPAREDESETALEGLASICTVLAVGLFIMTFVFQNFEIPSGSMQKTLLIGDHVLVDRITMAPPSRLASFLLHYREVRRGDVIVFYKPNSETPDLYLVKRAIALPGDRVHLRNGVVYLNGVAQKEPQAAMPVSDGDPQHSYQPYRDDFPSVPATTLEGATALWANELPSHVQGDDLVVPPGKVFALGDNRTESLDGRFWGFVPRENIVGRPLFVYWSFRTPADQMDKQSLGQRIAFMGHTALHFFGQTRWNRTFHLIK